jgi:hypothetical protein
MLYLPVLTNESYHANRPETEGWVGPDLIYLGFFVVSYFFACLMLHGCCDVDQACSIHDVIKL